MKPTIGRIVLYRDGINPDVKPAMIVEVHSDNCVSLVVFSRFGADPKASVVEGDADSNRSSWAWPELVASAAPLAPIQGETYGGFNPLALLGISDFGAIVGPLIVLLYTTQHDKIATGADRILTPPSAAVSFICDRLGVKDEGSRKEIAAAAVAWGDKGGDFLTAIADAVAAAKTGG